MIYVTLEQINVFFQKFTSAVTYIGITFSNRPLLGNGVANEFAD